MAAARSVLARGGPQALTVQAVAEEAGTYPDAVRYHFGGKAGLISAVVESLANDQGFRAIARMTARRRAPTCVHRLIEADHDLLRDDDSYRDFYALLSGIVLDDELRERVAVLYRGFRAMYGGVVGSEGGFSADELHALETLMIAVVDGLAVQKLLDPDSVRLDVVLPFWEDSGLSSSPSRPAPRPAAARERPGARYARPQRGPTGSPSGELLADRALGARPGDDQQLVAGLDHRLGLGHDDLVAVQQGRDHAALGQAELVHASCRPPSGPR